MSDPWLDEVVKLAEPETEEVDPWLDEVAARAAAVAEPVEEPAPFVLPGEITLAGPLTQEQRDAGAVQAIEREEQHLRGFAQRFLEGGEDEYAAQRFADKVPDRRKFLKILEEEIQKAPPKQRTIPSKFAQRFKRGMAGIGEGFRVFGQMLEGLPDQQMALEQEAQAMRRGYDPATSANPLLRGALGAAEMAPPMAQSLALGSVGRAGPFAFWYAKIAADDYQEFKADGFTEEEARLTAFITAAPQAAIELFFGGRGFKEFVPADVRRGAARAVVNVARHVVGITAKEWAEEPAQKAIQLGGKAYLDHIDENVKVDWKAEFGKTKAELAEAALVIPWLVAPGATVGGLARVAQIKDASRRNMKEVLPGVERWSKPRREAAVEVAKEIENAQAIPSDQAVPEEGGEVPVARRVQAPGGEDIQRLPEAGREVGYGEVPQAEEVPVARKVEMPPVARPDLESLSWPELRKRAKAAGVKIGASKPRLIEQIRAAEGGVPIARKLGRPELAIPATAPEARQLVRETDEARKQLGVPERRAEIIVEQEAQARLQADYAGERARLLSASRSGREFRDTDVRIARTIITQEGVQAIQSGDAKAIDDAVDLIWSYREARTETARAMRAGRDPVETPAQRQGRTIVEALLTPPSRITHKIEAALERGKDAEAERIRGLWREDINRLREKLKLLGLDLDRLNESTIDPVIAARALGTIQTAKADNWDAAYEYWNNAILSLPTTQAANIIGNLGHATWEMTAQRFTEALVNTIGGNPKEAQWGEFRHMLAGMLPGLSRGAQNFLRTWKSETPFLEAEFGRKAERKIEERGVSIAGKKGRLVRALGWRPLTAVDEFFKSLFAQIQVSAHAYRIAKAAGRKGSQLKASIAEQIANPKSEAWQLAIDDAVRLAFQERGGKVVQAILSVRKDVPGPRYVMPFVTTPGNIFRIGIRKSPLGLLSLANKIQRGIRTGTWKGVTPAIAEQILAWAFIAVLLSNDPDDPWITGAVKEMRRGPRYQARRTFPTQSVKIGGTWYSYSRIEPFATTISLMVDWMDAIKSGEPAVIAKVPFESLIGQVKNKTFLSGIGDFLNALDADQPAEALARWASSFAVSWVPNIVRGAGRARQDVYPYRGVWGKGPEWTTRLMRRTLQKTELGLIDDQPSVDLWGREAPRTPSPLGPRTDWLWRMTLPIRAKRENIAVGDQVIINWNGEHPDDEKYPALPSKRYTAKNGEKRYMNEEQYTQFLTLAGQAANQLIAHSTVDPEHPGEADLKVVTQSLSTARREAKKMLVVEWGGGAAAPEPETLANRILFGYRKNWKQGLKRRKGESRQSWIERRRWLRKRLGVTSPSHSSPRTPPP